MNGTLNVRDVVSAEEGHAKTKHRYAKTQPHELGFFDTNPLTLCGHSQLFVKSATDDEPVDAAV